MSSLLTKAHGEKDDSRRIADDRFGSAGETWRVFYAHWRQSLEQAGGLIHPEYLKGLEALALPTDSFPSLTHLETQLHRVGWRLVLVEGVVDDFLFCRMIKARKFPLAMQVRPFDRVFHAPAPDAIHDILGHLPWLFWPNYRRLLSTLSMGAQRIASAASAPNDSEAMARAWSRLFLWTVEFGLIGEGDDDRRILGAAIMSSPTEIDRIRGGAPAVRQLDASAFENDILYSDPQPLLYQFADFDSVGARLREMIRTSGGGRVSFQSRLRQAPATIRRGWPFRQPTISFGVKEKDAQTAAE